MNRQFTCSGCVRPRVRPGGGNKRCVKHLCRKHCQERLNEQILAWSDNYNVKITLYSTMTNAGKRQQCVWANLRHLQVGITRNMMLAQGSLNTFPHTLSKKCLFNTVVNEIHDEIQLFANTEMSYAIGRQLGLPDVMIEIVMSYMS